MLWPLAPERDPSSDGELASGNLLGAACSRANFIKGCQLLLLTAEQLEKIAQAYYKAAQDKSVLSAKRLEFRIEAMRGRILARLARKMESQPLNAE